MCFGRSLVVVENSRVVRFLFCIDTLPTHRAIMGLSLTIKEITWTKIFRGEHDSPNQT